MTAIGLAVAIPAVLGYNFIVRSNRITLARLDGFAHDLFTFLVTGAKVERRARRPPPAHAPPPRGEPEHGLRRLRGQRAQHAPMADINVIPLVDIMLVLLVIFIVTAPLLTHSVKIDLPKAASAAERVARAGQCPVRHRRRAARCIWDGEKIDRAQMLQRFAAAGAKEPARPNCTCASTARAHTRPWPMS